MFATALFCHALARVVNDDVAHRCCGDTQKMVTANGITIRFPQSQVGLIHDRGCLHRCVVMVARQLPMCQAAELGIKHSDDLIIGFTVTVLVRFDQLRDCRACVYFWPLAVGGCCPTNSN